MKAIELPVLIDFTFEYVNEFIHVGWYAFKDGYRVKFKNKTIGYFLIEKSYNPFAHGDYGFTWIKTTGGSYSCATFDPISDLLNEFERTTKKRIKTQISLEI